MCVTLHGLLKQQEVRAVRSSSSISVSVPGAEQQSEPGATELNCARLHTQTAEESVCCMEQCVCFTCVTAVEGSVKWLTLHGDSVYTQTHTHTQTHTFMPTQDFSLKASFSAVAYFRVSQDSAFVIVSFSFSHAHLADVTLHFLTVQILSLSFVLFLYNWLRYLRLLILWED